MKLHLSALLLLAASTAAQNNGYETELVYINELGSPFNVVPGLGVPFNAGTGSSVAFRRPYVSADGTQWAIECSAEDTAVGGNGFADVYIVNGSLLLQEGTQAPWAALGETVGDLDTRIGLNDSGVLLITNNTGGTAPNDADDYVVAYAGGIWTVIAKEGDLVDPILPGLAGATWDDTMTSPTLDNANNFVWEATGVDGTPGGSADDNFIVQGFGTMAVEGDIPAGQAGGAIASWQNFDIDDMYVSGDGVTTLIQGDTDDSLASDDDILVVNGVVVLQENHPIPGGPFMEPIDIFGIVACALDGAGNWYAHGNNDGTEQDWVVRNGVVVAISDAMQEIYPGAAEHWDDTTNANCFFAHDGNLDGAYVIGGITDTATDRNSVLVVDDGAGNRVVACREGDPVDVDGNGLFDDDRFLRLFGLDDVRMLADRSLLFVATLRDGSGSTTGQGFFRVNAKWTQYGGGSTPVNTLDLTGDGSTSLGQTFTAVTSGLHASAPASLTLISLSAANVPLFGGAVLINPAMLQSTVLVGVNTSGFSAASLTVPLSPSIIGTKAYFQSVANDPTQPSGKALSNGLEVTICE